MKTARILLGLTVALVATVLAVKPGYAAQMQRARDVLSNPRTGVSSMHTFSMSLPTGANVGTITFDFCTTPSGTCTAPTNLDITIPGSSLGSLTNLAGDWTLSNPGTSTTRLMIANSAPVANTAHTYVTVPITIDQNPDIGGGGCTTSGGSSGTCYVSIKSYSTYTTPDGNPTAGDLQDEAIVSFTVVVPVTVSARVDPTFTFVVSGIGASTGTNGLTTSVSSSYSTLPFGNLTANNPKYAAHQLNVTTNTQSGYTVTVQMQTPMTGVYAGNNIDPFVGMSATWSDPKTWTRPTGSTPSSDTGWIGANTNDSDVAGFTLAEFGPVEATARTVMSAASADNGATGVLVTYGIEANVYQPADTYTGTVVYNALPTY